MATKRVREAEEIKRRKVTRRRFRNLVRSVMFNRIWLMDAGEQKLSLNVKKNIAMLIRTQRKIGILTLAEKALIRTHHTFRSIEDRKKLVTLLAGLKCFLKIPPIQDITNFRVKVFTSQQYTLDCFMLHECFTKSEINEWNSKTRARLVPVIKFMYLERGRKLISEGDPPNTVYFILTGEVELTKRVFDHLKNAYTERVELISGPGDCLGDIEMIEEIPRINTCICTTDVELLLTFREEFDVILRPIMTKQWQEKKSALFSLGYFNYLTEEQIIGTCKIGVLRQFEPLETICYEDKGHVSYVHFVISGECMILQCLKMKVTQKKGNKVFELVDISKDDADTMFQDLTNKELMKILREEGTMKSTTMYDIENEIASDDDTLGEKDKRKMMRKMDIKTIEISCGLAKSEEEALESEISYAISRDESEYEDISEESDYLKISKSVEDIDILGTELEADEQNRINADESEGIRESHKQSHIRIEEGGASQERLIESIHISPADVLLNGDLPPTEQSTRIENHFIDVGSLFFGGIFGLGERLEHRVIMARTTVQCLMLPRFWLFEKERNPGNIWQRRRFYLDTTIPSRQTLFKNFLTTRRWQKFKKDLIESNLNPDSIANPTKIQDIPIICRIVEANEE